MENIDKAVIVNCGVHSWYGIGSKRLEKSLNYVGWAGQTLIFSDEYPSGSAAHDDIPYYMKIAALEQAIANGATHLLWLDSSFWAVNNPMKMFDIINEQGYWLFSTGYNLAQSVNDESLAFVGKTRDEAEQKTEWASGCCGFNLNNPNGKKLYERWKFYMDAGLSKGSRLHDNQSADPRFLFHRNDQSCLNLAAWELGLTNERGLDMVAYWNSGNPGYNKDEIIFFIGGI